MSLRGWLRRIPCADIDWPYRNCTVPLVFLMALDNREIKCTRPALLPERCFPPGQRRWSHAGRAADEEAQIALFNIHHDCSLAITRAAAALEWNFVRQGVGMLTDHPRPASWGCGYVAPRDNCGHLLQQTASSPRCGNGLRKSLTVRGETLQGRDGRFGSARITAVAVRARHFAKCRERP
jgi:hypothetical protein